VIDDFALQPFEVTDTDDYCELVVEVKRLCRRKSRLRRANPNGGPPGSRTLRLIEQNRLVETYER